MPVASQHLLGGLAVEINMARVEPAVFIRSRVHLAGPDMQFVGYDDSIVEMQNDVALLLVGGLDPETGADTSGHGRRSIAAEDPMDTLPQCPLRRLSFRGWLSCHVRSLLKR